MISKRLVMVCVRQETSNTMFTILSLCLVSVNVLTALLMCRTWLIRVYFSSQYYDLFQITILSFHYVLIRAQPRTVDLRLPQVTDVRLYVTQQLSIGTFTATLHLRHVERSEDQDTGRCARVRNSGFTLPPVRSIHEYSVTIVSNAVRSS